MHLRLTPPYVPWLVPLLQKYRSVALLKQWRRVRPAGKKENGRNQLARQRPRNRRVACRCVRIHARDKTKCCESRVYFVFPNDVTATFWYGALPRQIHLEMTEHSSS